MPPTPKAAPSGGGSAQKKPGYVMPKPPPVVFWRNAPGGDSAYAIITKVNRHSVSLILFPPDSRAGVPKDGVRAADDPWNQVHGIDPDAGVWEYTEESLLLRKLAARDEPAA